MSIKICNDTAYGIWYVKQAVLISLPEKIPFWFYTDNEL